MAGEVRQEFRITPSRLSNQNGRKNHLNLANGLVAPDVYEFAATKAVTYQVRLQAIGNDVHLTTPNAKARISWVTNLTDVTNAAKFYLQLVSAAPGESIDPNAGAFSADLDDDVQSVSTGRGNLNVATIDIPNAMVVRGNMLIGLLTRDDADGGDPLSGTIGVLALELEADKA